MSENSQPQSRRALLLAGGVAALAAGAVVTDSTDASAANGGAFLLGKANAASAPTAVTSSSPSSGLVATSTNAATTAHGIVGNAKGGYGLVGSSTAYHGAKTYTANSARHGLVAENTATTHATGVALHAKHYSTLASGQAPTVVRAVQAGVEAVQTQLRQQFGPSCGEFAGKRNGLLAHGTSVGVIGVSGPNGTGVAGRGSVGVHARSDTVGGRALYAHGFAANSYGIYATAARNYLSGDTQVNGNLAVNGTLTKSGGSFRIDHPLDPGHKYLSHSFVESPDMKNIYDGVVVANSKGEATVELPDWFEALNRDFRYQLTPIGKPTEQLYVSAEISGNAFSIAGASPGQRVCWQVTGIRKDVWANENRIPVEHDKAPAELGRYLYPEGFGEPANAGLTAPKIP